MEKSELTEKQKEIYGEALKVSIETCVQDVKVLEDDMTRFFSLRDQYGEMGDEKKANIIESKIADLVDSRARRIAMLQGMETDKKMSDMFFFEYMVRFLPC
jgi:hypothetical protein